MIRGVFLWLAGVVCGVAISYWVFTTGIIPDPGACASAPPPPAVTNVSPEIECLDEAQFPEHKSVVKPATEVDAVRRQPDTGAEEEVFVLFVLQDESHLNPEADAEPLMTGGGPPATLVCDYRSETDGSIMTKSSHYDSLMLPLPSCPYELQLPVE